MKKNGFVSVILILAIVILGVVGYVIYKGYLSKLVPANILPSLSGNIFKSKTYNFSWDEASKNASLMDSKSGKELLNFELSEKPVDVFLYKPTNVLAIVTGSKGTPENLYIFKNGTLSPVYKGETIVVRDDFKYVNYIFKQTESDEIRKNGIQSGDKSVSFSPDGRYLIFAVGGFESYEPYIYSLESSKISKADVRSYYWSLDSKCILSANSMGMEAAAVKLGKLSGSEFRFEEPQMIDELSQEFNVLDTNKLAIYWNDGCGGYIKGTDLYKFSYNDKRIELVGNLGSDNLGQQTDSSYQENIYANLEP